MTNSLVLLYRSSWQFFLLQFDSLRNYFTLVMCKAQPKTIKPQLLSPTSLSQPKPLNRAQWGLGPSLRVLKPWAEPSSHGSVDCGYELHIAIIRGKENNLYNKEIQIMIKAYIYCTFEIMDVNACHWSLLIDVRQLPVLTMLATPRVHRGIE
jgi:hypothetical protein